MHRRAGLGQVRQTHHVRAGPGLGELAEGLEAGVEVGQHDGLEPAGRGDPPHAQGDLGDDTQDPLAAQEERPQVRPAAEEGARPSRSVPRGVATTIASTVASLRPYPVEDWPAERVAAYPPMLARSQDCGTCPQVSPRAASSRSRTGPVMPGLHPRRAGDDVDVEQLGHPVETDRHDARPPPGVGPDPTDDARAPAERHQREPAGLGGGEQGHDLVVRAGGDDGVGHLGCVAERRSSRSTYDSPPAWASRRFAIHADVLRPDRPW